MPVGAGQRRFHVSQTDLLWEGRSLAAVFLWHLLAGFFFCLSTNQNVWLGGLDPQSPGPDKGLILENSVLDCTCLIVYQLNWKKKKKRS